MSDLTYRRGEGRWARVGLAVLLVLGVMGSAVGAPARAPAQVAAHAAVLSVSDSPEYWWPCDSELQPFASKDVYVIAQLDPNLGGLQGAEFSVYGLDQQPNLLILSYEWGGVGITVVGPTPWAPADTSATSTGLGGIHVMWSECRTGTVVPLLRISLLALGPVTPHPVEILRRYPPTNPVKPQPLVVLCDGPLFTTVPAESGCYWLNQPYACWLCVDAVELQTWGGVKGLFK